VDSASQVAAAAETVALVAIVDLTAGARQRPQRLHTVIATRTAEPRALHSLWCETA
jgi:hypothetical protein